MKTKIGALIIGWCGVLSFIFTAVCLAEPVNQDQVRQMVAGWLNSDSVPLDVSIGNEIKEIKPFFGLGYAVYLNPAGVVIVPADDRIEPILAFAGKGIFDPAMDHSLTVLVLEDLEARMRFLETVKATDQAGETGRAKNKWQYLKNCTRIQNARQSGVSDLRVPALVQSAWDQESEGGAYDYCYDYYTPNHYPCGCVATAMAQLMRYHRYPTAAVGPRQFEVTVENDPNPYWTMTMLGGDGAGGPYNWDMMTLDPDASTTEAQRQAIGALCLDAGISVNMRYGPIGSSADMFVAKDSIHNVFYYVNIIAGYNGSEYIGAGLIGMVNPNLDAGYPVLLGIYGTGGGHAIVCDGYGYNNGTMYHHLNMGWGAYYATDNVWYALPNIDATLSFDCVNACLYNIFPAGSGEIISGRISDAYGNPISGATVIAYLQGGGQYQASSNRRGIYALAGVPSSSGYTLTVAKGGFSFTARSVATGVSTLYNNVAGNQAGVDFVGSGVYASEPVVYPVMGDYDGNGFSELALYRDDLATWYIKVSGAINNLSFGTEGCQAVMADFDGDHKADSGLYHDGLGLWALKLSGSGYVTLMFSFGNPGSHPAAADFDGDGKADPALFQESTGTWLILLSKSNYALNSLTTGGPGCRPVAGDFDGDGLGDPAVYQYASGYWNVMMSAQGYQPTIFPFGAPGDQPAAGDYDGDLKADPAIYQYSSGRWMILQSASSYSPATVTFFGN